MYPTKTPIQPFKLSHLTPYFPTRSNAGLGNEELYTYETHRVRLRDDEIRFLLVPPPRFQNASPSSFSNCIPPLVPKLHFGTHLDQKLRLHLAKPCPPVSRFGDHSPLTLFATLIVPLRDESWVKAQAKLQRKCVPKCNLGTR